MSTTKIRLNNIRNMVQDNFVTVTDIDFVQDKKTGKIALLGENSGGYVVGFHSNLQYTCFIGNFISVKKALEIKALLASNDFDAVYKQKDDLLSD